MCGRFNLTASGEEIAEAFDLDDTPELAPRFNIAPTQPIEVVRYDTASRRPRLGTVIWGLVPSGAPESDRGFINARAETAWQKPSFRDAFARRRCLIPATGFYEWQTLSLKPRRRQAWAFALGSGRPFAFAGLWEPPARAGAPPTCTILTTDANDVTRPVHDRMPVILEPDGYARWLDSEPSGALAARGGSASRARSRDFSSDQGAEPHVYREYSEVWQRRAGGKDPASTRSDFRHGLLALRPLLRPFPSQTMTAWTVSPAVNNPRCDEPVCLERVEEEGPPPLLR